MAPRKKKETQFEKRLRTIFYTPKQGASFAGTGKLRRAVKHDTRIKRKPKNLDKKIHQWLSYQDTYTLHKPVRRRFIRSRVVVSGIDDQWQTDLICLSKEIAKANGNHHFILTCIDILSKYGFAIALKNKQGATLVAAFQKILKSGRKCKRLQSDQGREYTNKKFQKFLKDNKIEFFTTFNEETKASVCERFNKTLKSKLWKYFTKNSTLKFLDVLDDLVWSYNHSWHRSIQMEPSQVSRLNQEEVWQRLYGRSLPKSKKCTLKPGDLIRISKYKGKFEKGYLPSWSDEIFYVNKVLNTQPPRLKVEDEAGSVLKGSFYTWEVQKITKQDRVYRINEILKERVRNGRKQVLVSWKGYPSSMNSWIGIKDLRNYKG